MFTLIVNMKIINANNWGIVINVTILKYLQELIIKPIKQPAAYINNKAHLLIYRWLKNELNLIL